MKMDETSEESQACIPLAVNVSYFNMYAHLPYGLTPDHIHRAMNDFIDFLGFINQQLHTRQIPRLESFLMPASFSSMVGEFMGMNIPQYCPYLVKNQYHNGHPDLIPRELFPGDAVQYAREGLEIKGSRHAMGWQGHNPEAVWLMVFHFDSNTANDKQKGIVPKPFRFLGVYAAKLEMEDWSFSGRTGASRRTITASVNKAGVAKMKANWIYQDLSQTER